MLVNNYPYGNENRVKRGWRRDTTAIQREGSHLMRNKMAGYFMRKKIDLELKIKSIKKF
jgi:hypothetical protein